MTYSRVTVGGYTTGPKQLIQLLRQRSRPYLFSNTLPPPVVGGASKVSCCWSRVMLLVHTIRLCSLISRPAKSQIYVGSEVFKRKKNWRCQNIVFQCYCMSQSLKWTTLQVETCNYCDINWTAGSLLFSSYEVGIIYIRQDISD